MLGPLEALVDGTPAGLGGLRRRSLLARLLLEPNRVVPADRLIDDLWGDQAGPKTLNALQVNISSLRNALEPDKEQRTTEPVLSNVAGGYVVRVGDDELDSLRFDRLLSEGRRLLNTGAVEQAVVVLDQAIDEFRGQPLPDLVGQPCAEPEIARLAEALDAAREDRIDALLASGQHAQVVPQLERLTREAPLRERRWSQLMLALYRGGRQSDALRAYTAVRELLAEELGVEPSPLLKDLEQAMLLQRPELDVRLRATLAPNHGTITIVFTDIAGSTALAQRLGDMEYDQVRAEHLQDVRRIAEGGGGQVVNGAGDGFLLRFASASAAVRAAIDVQRRAAAGPVAVKIGIDAGEPVETPDHDLVGTPVNRAARLADAADGGEILVSATVRALIEPRGEVRFGASRTIVLKGFEGPQEVHVVPWSEEIRRRVRHPAPLVATDSYLGRAPELATLRTAWRQAGTGPGAVGVVAGEPGVGKTRLAAELSREVAASGGLVLYGRCERGGSSYEPFNEALGRYLGDLDDREAGAVIGGRGSDLAAVVPSLGDRFPVADAPHDIEPGLRRLRLHEAVGALLGDLGAERPALLILDDLQWADAATVALVGHVCRSEAVRMVVLAYRHSDVDRDSPIVTALADLRRVRPVESIQLHGLDVDEVGGCVQARAGRACSPAVARLVHTRTGGNPLLVEELTRSLVAEDALADEARAASTAEVPEGVRSLVELRINTLDDDSRAALEGAAVLGAEFDWEALPDTASTSADVVVASLDRLVANGLLIEVRGTAGRYGFVHDLVRQALYGGLGSARRLTLHRRAAAAIAGFPSSRPAEVAHHLVAGATPATALEASDAAAAAAEDAAARFAHEEACRWYRQALEVLGDGGSVNRRAQLQLELAASLSVAGDFATGREGYRQAAALAEQAGDGPLLGRAALGFSGPTMAMWVQWGTVDEELADLLDRADLAIDPIPSPLRASLLATRAAHMAVVYPDEADRWSAAALAMAESLGDRESERDALIGRRLAVWRAERLEERLALDARLVELAGPARPREEFDARTFLLMDLVEAGRMGEADVAAARIKAIGERLDYSFATWNAMRYECMRLAMAGRFDEAVALGAEALQLGMGANPENATASYGGIMIGNSFHRNEVDGVSDTMRMFAATVIGPSPYDAFVPFFLAEEGRLDDAQVEIRALAARLDEVPTGPNWLSTLGVLAYPVNALGERDIAADLYERLRPCSGMQVMAGGIVYTLGPVDRFLGLLAETMGDYDAADHHLAAANDLSRTTGCRIYEALGLVEHGRVLLKAGRDAARARECLAAADALASELDLRLVRKKLDQLEGIG